MKYDKYKLFITLKGNYRHTPYCKRNILFTNRRQEGREVNEPVYSVSDDDLLEAFKVKDVGEDVGPAVPDLVGGSDDVRHDDVLSAVLWA